MADSPREKGERSNANEEMNKDLRQLQQQTSSSQSLPPTGQRVFVRAINSNFDSEFFSFPLNFSDLDGNRKRERGIGGDDSQILSTLGSKTGSLFSGFAVVDATIYCIGGNTPRKHSTWKVYDDVYSLNTSHVRKTWETSPSMRGARSFSQVVTLNGKIYVMGAVGSKKGGPEPWAEVFDPKSGKCGSWSPLDPPYPKPSIDRAVFEAFSAALPHTNQILVGSALDTFICLYDVGSNRWKHLKDIEFLSPPSYECPPVVAGKTLFWFRHGILNAYDLELKLNYAALIKGLEDIVPPHVFELRSGFPSPKLLCPADKDFCLALACFEYSMSEKDLVLLHWIRISVSPVAASGEETGFHASVRGSKSYYFKMSYPIRDAMLIYESMKFEEFSHPAEAALEAAENAEPRKQSSKETSTDGAISSASESIDKTVETTRDFEEVVRPARPPKFRGRPASSVSQSMSVLDLSSKEKSGKPPRRLSIPAKSTGSPVQKIVGNITPILEARARSSVRICGKNDSSVSDVSKSSMRKKFNLLTSASYWLSQIKCSECAAKHTISLGFFKLALEAGCESLQRMRDELKSYAQRHNLVELGVPVKELFESYGISGNCDDVRSSSSMTTQVSSAKESAKNTRVDNQGMRTRGTWSRNSADEKSGSVEATKEESIDKITRQGEQAAREQDSANPCKANEALQAIKENMVKSNF